MKKKTIQEKGCFRKNLAIILGLLVFWGVAGAAQAANSRFQEVEGSNGSIVRDNNSGLEWQRCPHGQRWTGARCIGTVWRGNWYDAVQITAPDGFRLPTIHELKTLAPYDQSIFPEKDWFWSSSDNSGTGCAWSLDFYAGYVYGGHNKGTSKQARLVRVGQ